MSDLFIKLYLDEDVDVFIAELLRAQNFQAVSVSEVGRRGKSDAEQLEYAVSKNYAILTHNRVDFEELAQDYFFDNLTHYGIIISVQRPPREIKERLLDILNKFTADEMINQIVYI